MDTLICYIYIYIDVEVSTFNDVDVNGLNVVTFPFLNF